ncbi:MAG: hypothetical protein EBU90_09985 [Proteobacteria bacterium]|nr:hypothetical protein [Pseudomonadota bacterium]NBP14917.1 hypothetical protein [bacterium]
MASLLSGKTLRRGGSGQYIDLAGAMPQLPATDTTLTGFTLVTDSLLRTSYSSALGFIQFTSASMYSSLPSGSIRILNTGGSTVVSINTTTGLLIVDGDIGVGGTMNIWKDIKVNGITIGKGYDLGVNNIVVRGTASPQLTAYEDGQQSIAIGYDVLQGLQTSYKNIAIGRYALSSGTSISNNIAIGDSALKKVGVIQTEVVATITNILLGTITNVTSPGHGIPSGTRILVGGVSGTTEVNNNYYYLGTDTSSTFILFSDLSLTTYVDSSAFTPYIAGGTVSVDLTNDSNVALGTDAGTLLKNGTHNVIIGHEAGNILTTGSYNIIIGPLASQFLTTGSGIISIGGDNIVDGLNDQVNIGSVFYYDGNGYATVNADTTLGIGTTATILSTGTFSSSSTVTAGVVVLGGVFAYENAIIGKTIDVLGTGTSSFGSSIVPSNSGLSLGSASNPWAALYVSGSTIYLGSATLSSPSALTFNVTSTSGYITQTVGNLTLDSGAASLGSTSGSLVVVGGAGIQGSVNIDGQLKVKGIGSVDLSPVGANVVIKPTASGLVDIRPNTLGSMDNVTIGALDSANGYFENVQVLSTTSATSTVSGALQVVGGVGIRGDIYSRTGNPDENYLLYSPRVTVSTSSPSGARIGDFWIEPTIPAFLQYILDGTSTIWVQIGTV